MNKPHQRSGKVITTITAAPDDSPVAEPMPPSHKPPLDKSWLLGLSAWAEKRTGIDRFRLSFCVAGVALVYTMIFHGPMTSKLIGFVYPAFATVQMLQELPANAVDTDHVRSSTKWFTYWLMFAIIMIFEQPFGQLLRLMIPFYYVLKTAFFVWCFVPTKNNGSAFLYTTVIRPCFGTTDDFEVKQPENHS